MHGGYELSDAGQQLFVCISRDQSAEATSSSFASAWGAGVLLGVLWAVHHQYVPPNIPVPRYMLRVGWLGAASHLTRLAT
jgi:hypothetical protein